MSWLPLTTKPPNHPCRLSQRGRRHFLTLDPRPLDVVAHNATVILSGVLLGALLAFITFHLGWLRHHVRLNDRLVNAIFPLGPQVFFFTLPLWFIVTLRPAARFSGMHITVVWSQPV